MKRGFPGRSKNSFNPLRLLLLELSFMDWARLHGAVARDSHAIASQLPFWGHSLQRNSGYNSGGIRDNILKGNRYDGTFRQ